MLEKLPLVALAAGDCLMTLVNARGGGVAVAWPVRIGNAAVSCVTYVVQLFYPVDLAAFYPVPPGGRPPWKVAGALAILVAISAAAVIWRRQCPYVFVGWFWYLGMLSPVLGLVQVADHAMADRYMYLPGIGLYIASPGAPRGSRARRHARRWVLGSRAGGRDCRPDGLRHLADVVLARRRDVVESRLGCTTENSEAEVWPGRRADAARPNRRRDYPLPPGGSARD